MPPFSAIPPSEWLASNHSAFAIADRYPVTQGHTLVVPRRLISTWWDATPDERADLWALVDEVKAQLDGAYHPGGYNLGMNVGAAAGQTVPHLHIHVIPRYDGDVADPAGGIRHVMPGRGIWQTIGSADLVFPATGISVELFDGRQHALQPELVRCLRDRRFDRVDLVVSFIMRSGLTRLDPALVDALDGGAKVRVLTTDYLGVTDADALARLLDLAETQPVERLRIRVFHDAATSFHPKGYLFWSSSESVAAAFVGSSNLSASGISGGVEWSVGLDQIAPMLVVFEDLWTDPRSQPLTTSWLADYRQRRPPAGQVIPIGVEIEPPQQPEGPSSIQREALDALEQTRQDGYQAALVVMATGLGKTWLAAFDSTRPEFRRVLFIAHREEILRQARNVFRRVHPSGNFGFFNGQNKQPDAQVVFASIQTLAGRLGQFDPNEFDYVVVDEFHHAAAPSYRSAIDYFTPRFLLGLTATPDRMDGADLLALCGDNLVFDCNLVEGIRRDELCRFEYYGIRDIVDFTPIPWRNGKFDPEALTRAVETQERAEQAFDEWASRRGKRTLAFCCSITHAEFTARFFVERGVRAVAVHSGAGSAPRQASIEALTRGDLDVIFTVDMFNEGLDLPAIDTVLMLRPTESPIIFLQQLGRGLRIDDDKQGLTVVDFIGNHRSFLIKPRTLLSLGASSAPSVAAVLKAMSTGEFELPPGCSVSYQLGLVDMFRQLVRLGDRSAMEEYCRSHMAEEGVRPSAMQAFAAGFNPTSVRSRHGSWFGFMLHLEMLSETEAEVVARHGDILAGLEAEPATKAYKLVTLRAMLRDGTLRSGSAVATLAKTARRLTVADPRLIDDARSTEMPDPAAVTDGQWESYWRRWPLAAWAGELKGQPGRWFSVIENRFNPNFTIEDRLASTFDAMVAELVEFRLARHLLGKATRRPGEFLCKLGHADGRPLVWLDRGRYPQIPEGEIEFVADDRRYVGNFAKIALNLASTTGHQGNALHSLLRGWFGPSAGHPGTIHQVVLRRVGDHWVMSPLEADASSTAAV